MPLVDSTSSQAALTQLDAAARTQIAASLRACDRPFSEMLNGIPMPTVMLDGQGRIIYCNDELLRLTGWLREQMLGRDWFEMVVWTETGEVKRNVAAAIAGNVDPWHRENIIVTRTGERRRMRWSNALLRSDTGAVIGIASIGEDLTDQKRADKRVRQLNRVYAVLSGINALIVRVRDRDELCREACRIALEHGGFLMALICIAEPDSDRIVPVASAGMTGELLEQVTGVLRSTEGARNTVLARTILEKSTIVLNDSQSDPRVLFPGDYARAGVRSMAVLPLIIANDAVGALALYARESEFFQDEEIRLLTDLTGNISFALDGIEKQKRLDYLAYYDVLTGLANRGLFLERLELLARQAVTGGHKLAVFLIDLERFKNINDSLGRPAGDKLLVQVAQWLISRVADTTLLARVGANQFAVVLPEVNQEGDVARLLEKTVEALPQQVFRLDDTDWRIGAKVGAALFPDDGAGAGDLLMNAEAALKKAKARGDRFLFFTEQMTAKVAGTLTMENQLRQAVDRQEFVLHYQPKVCLRNGQVTGAEALIRWNDPRTGLVPPAVFIPVLEETGLIFDVGRWALQQAIADYLRWCAAGLVPVRIAVNVSPLQLRHHGFIAEIERTVGIDARAAAALELEITETLIMEDVKLSIDTLQAIRALGVTVAVDDFGTGFSSLSYLHKLPVDALKIDRSFVSEMTVAPEGLALVSTIINLARWLKLTVVAEGVETEEQSRLLRLLSCDEMQGFIVSKPLPVASFEAAYLQKVAQ